jgi:hypothetical protein
MKVRLKVNLILDGKLVPFDSIIDDQLVPEHQRTAEIVDYSLESRDDGKVMALKDLAFQSIPKRGSDGVKTSYPVYVMASELFELAQVSASHLQLLKKGVDYATKWTREEQLSLRKAADEVYLKHFESEPAPAGARGAR